ncbi:LysR family transcriptional regulator [Sneathiella chinensis]|uniref:LysR family transcriptional regulator n=1 Tax=Sneathiella chinensis TaxID=349750 RepID=A0ABQ5U5S7_9PROT|nr:LysR family transcriptional regulator [Sneathiella chinensis]GLQ06741.1 LysR family transcriptional regulator [Sneathiella chinensis]
MSEQKLTQLPSMEWLKSFEAAGRHGNFTAAGREIGLTQASISQHIHALENRLGVPLFRRLPRGVELTPDGEAYLGLVSNALAMIRRGTTDLFGRTRRKVSIMAPASVSSLWVAGRLKPFAALCPEVELSLSSIHRQVDYSVVKSDYEIRFGDGNWPDRDGVQLYQEVLVPVALPALLKGVGDWRELPVLSVTGSRDGWREWAEISGTLPQKSPAFRFDSFIAALNACLSGAGVLLGSLPLVRPLLEDGRLAIAEQAQLTMTAGSWLTWPAKRPQDRIHEALITVLCDPDVRG